MFCYRGDVQSDSRCQLVVGSILQRTCNRTGSGRCANCGRLACAAHLRTSAAASWCEECLRQRPSNSGSSWDRSQDPGPDLIVLPSFDSTAGASIGAGTEPTWEGGGGEFGGGGASGSWDEPSAFSPTDYAAFDRTVEADRNEQHGSYDS